MAVSRGSMRVETAAGDGQIADLSGATPGHLLSRPNRAPIRSTIASAPITAAAHPDRTVGSDLSAGSDSAARPDVATRAERVTPADRRHSAGHVTEPTLAFAASRRTTSADRAIACPGRANTPARSTPIVSSAIASKCGEREGSVPPLGRMASLAPTRAHGSAPARGRRARGRAHHPDHAAPADANLRAERAGNADRRLRNPAELRP